MCKNLGCIFFKQRGLFPILFLTEAFRCKYNVLSSSDFFMPRAHRPNFYCRQKNWNENRIMSINFCSNEKIETFLSDNLYAINNWIVCSNSSPMKQCSDVIPNGTISLIKKCACALWHLYKIIVRQVLFFICGVCWNSPKINQMFTKIFLPGVGSAISNKTKNGLCALAIILVNKIRQCQ